MGTSPKNKLDGRFWSSANKNRSSASPDEVAWSISLLEDFNVNITDLGGLTTVNAKQLYEKFEHLKDIKTGALFAMHTKFFLKENGTNTALLSLMTDNVEKLQELVTAGKYSHDELKELQILAAFFGSKATLHYLTDECKLAVDDEVLNAALLSGEFIGEQLKELTATVRPTYNSIRYAVKSGNENNVDELINTYGLMPQSEHLVIAASMGDANLFDFLIKKGITPSGSFVYKAAALSHNEEILTQLAGFGYSATHMAPSLASKIKEMKSSEVAPEESTESPPKMRHT